MVKSSDPDCVSVFMYVTCVYVYVLLDGNEHVGYIYFANLVGQIVSLSRNTYYYYFWNALFMRREIWPIFNIVWNVGYKSGASKNKRTVTLLDFHASLLSQLDDGFTRGLLGYTLVALVSIDHLGCAPSWPMLMPQEVYAN